MAKRQKKIENISIARGVFDLAVEFVTTVEEAGGTIEDARRAIFKDEVLRKQLGLLVMGKLPLDLLPCQRLVPHLIPDWVKEVVEDVEPTVTEGSTLSFPGFLREEDNVRVDGPTMRQRAAEMGAGKGLADVPAILGKDGKGLSTIPAELRGKVFIVLTGTILRHSNGHLFVPYLFWNGGWVVGFGWFDFDWGGDAWIMGFDCIGGDWCVGGRLVACE